MLSGPLPASLTRLAALRHLLLEGSGLCVPDTPAMQAWVAAIPDFTGVFCIGLVTFSRVVTQPGDGVFGDVVAVADLNGDGRDDVVAATYLEYNAAREDRLTKLPLRVLVNLGDGRFRHAPELVEGTIDVRTSIVVTDDFNGDSRLDLAVFDAGVYVLDESTGVGNPPQLFLSRPDGRLHPSDALAEAVGREHALRPQPYYSGLADLHLKSATSGDVDGDGDIDLWVDSIGGANVSSHFMVNNGDGTFTVDEERAPTALRYNSPEAWYHLQGHLVDLDNDGDLDLALAQNRGLDPSTFDQSSIALINDGTGRYPARIELPRPAFHSGFTSVTGQTHFDVDGDGFQDLLLVHPRNDDGPPDEIPWTGPLRSGARQPRRELLRRRDARPDGRSERNDAGARPRRRPPAQFRGADDARRRPRRLHGSGHVARRPRTHRIAARVPQRRKWPLPGHVARAVRRIGSLFRVQRSARGRERRRGNRLRGPTNQQRARPPLRHDGRLHPAGDAVEHHACRPGPLQTPGNRGGNAAGSDPLRGCRRSRRSSLAGERVPKRVDLPGSLLGVGRGHRRCVRDAGHGHPGGPRAWRPSR